MRLGDIIKPDAVKVLGATSSKKRLFQDLGDLAQTVYAIPTHQTVEALLERELLGLRSLGKSSPNRAWVCH